MWAYLQSLLDSSSLSPHGICLLWRPELIWLHVASDLFIAIAYFSIPFALSIFVSKRPDVEFGWVFWAFAVFIMACGTTHVLSIWTLWFPDYAIEGGVKALTATVSMITAIGLWPLVPKALALPSPEQLRKANEALRVEIEERNRALRALEREKEERLKAEEMLRQSQKMEAVGQLTAGIAHDFNNLLTVIMGNLERVTRRLPGDDRDVRRAIEGAMMGARRAAALTQRLLAFGRRQPLAPRTLDVNTLIEHAADTLRRTIGEKIEVATELQANLWLARIDPDELENAVLNLAVNARDAMPGGGRLTLETRNRPLADAAAGSAGLPSGEYVEITVSDTGVGMSPEIAAHAFEPFFTTKAVGEGSGLGLSQVYGFARQSNGAVVLHSAVGQGTSLRMLLPRAVKAAAEQESQAAAFATVPVAVPVPT